MFSKLSNEKRSLKYTPFDYEAYANEHRALENFIKRDEKRQLDHDSLKQWEGAFLVSCNHLELMWPKLKTSIQNPNPNPAEAKISNMEMDEQQLHKAFLLNFNEFNRESVPLKRVEAWLRSRLDISATLETELRAQTQLTSTHTSTTIAPPTPSASTATISIRKKAIQKTNDVIQRIIRDLRITKAEMLFCVLLHMFLCRTPSISSKFGKVYLPTLKSLPLLLSNSISNHSVSSSHHHHHNNPTKKASDKVHPSMTLENGWYPLSMSLFMPIVINRLRRFSLQHTKASRKSTTWPSHQQLEDLKVLMEGLFAGHFPCFPTKDESKISELQRNLPIAIEPSFHGGILLEVWFRYLLINNISCVVLCVYV
jgi:hypothetical protein